MKRGDEYYGERDEIERVYVGTMVSRNDMVGSDMIGLIVVKSFTLLHIVEKYTLSGGVGVRRYETLW